MCFDCDEESVTRRAFITGATAAVAGMMLGAKALAQEQPYSKALTDPNVIHDNVTFKNGADTINGFLARPKAKGRHRAIIIIHGDPGIPEWVQNLSARLAQIGYAGMVVDIGSRKEDKPIEFYRGNAFDRRATQDILAGIEYVKAQPFVKRGGVGMVGFCYGGRKALMLPTESRDVKASVSFYGPVRDHVFRSASDPRPEVIEVAKQIKVPVQGHYGLLDKVALTADAKEFEQTLKAQGTPVEMFYYEGVGHGFYGNTWQQQTPEFGYNAEAAKLADERMVKFLKRKLK